MPKNQIAPLTDSCRKCESPAPRATETTFLIAKKAKYGAPYSGSSLPWDRAHNLGRPANRISGRYPGRLAPVNAQDPLLRDPRGRTRSPPGAGRPRSLAETRGCCSGTRSRSGAPGRPATQSTETEQSEEAADGPETNQPQAQQRLRRGNPAARSAPSCPPVPPLSRYLLSPSFLPPGCTNLWPSSLARKRTGAGSDVFRPRTGRYPARPFPVLGLDLANAVHLAPCAAASSWRPVLILRLGPPGLARAPCSC